MGGCDHASPLPAHEGRAFYLPADCYRDPIGFFRRLRTTFWGGRKNDERDPWPSHCRGLRASLCQRRGGISSASPCIGDHIRGLDRRVGSSISLITVPFSQRSLEGACGKAVRCGNGPRGAPSKLDSPWRQADLAAATSVMAAEYQ